MLHPHGRAHPRQAPAHRRLRRRRRPRPPGHRLPALPRPVRHHRPVGVNRRRAQSQDEPRLGGPRRLRGGLAAQDLAPARLHGLRRRIFVDARRRRSPRLVHGFLRVADRHLGRFPRLLARPPRQRQARNPARPPRLRPRHVPKAPAACCAQTRRLPPLLRSHLRRPAPPLRRPLLRRRRRPLHASFFFTRRCESGDRRRHREGGGSGPPPR
mmetsp:Transcript_1388/g.4053  ORF Transcript_1388/g.4053 Transcript_1388/m.4053 type:complete len:212 (-) Transcript_1388:191-826(-)